MLLSGTKYINNNTVKSVINNIQIRYITENNETRDMLKKEKKQLYQEYENLKNDMSKKYQALKSEMSQFVSEANNSMKDLTGNEKSAVRYEIKEILDANKEYSKEYKELNKESKTFYAESTSTRSSFESIDCDTERKILDVKTEQGDASVAAKDAILEIFTQSRNIKDFTKQGLTNMGDSIEKHTDNLNQTLDDQDELLQKYDRVNQDYKASASIKTSEENTLDVTEQTTRSRSSSVETVIPISDLPEAVNQGKSLDSEQVSLQDSNSKDTEHNMKDSDNSDNKDSNIKQNSSNTNEQTGGLKEISGLAAINTITDLVSNIDLSNTGLF